MQINLEETLTHAVKDAVRAEAHKLQGAVALNDHITSILAKPIMRFPDDVMTVLGTGRTTTFELAKDPDFPPVPEVGRRRVIRTPAFMGYLDAKAEVA